MRKIILLICLCCLSLTGLRPVQAATQQVPVEMLYAFAENHLHNKLQQDPLLDYQLELLTRLTVDFTLPAGEVKLQVGSEPIIRYDMPTQVPVSVYVNGQRFLNISLAYKIKKYDLLLVANKNLSNGETIDFTNVRLEKRESTRDAEYVKSIEEVVGLKLKRSVSVDTVLLKNYLDKPQLIRRGLPVMIISRQGNIEVNAPGIALQNGVLGDKIRVRNSSSGKIVVGEVMDANNVRI
ncbi:flagellar basal body P-ring formation chaperone FlgA [Succinispira mobilis]|uniref:flagellar basal body P-ring formation chaperone FlgA n=1 Tax=Succinispira mobilis TaxID=78120 RepID=UPI00039D19E3|nr:flagellar basal body P-ring formation chaperone FlgA [Succinispira mobilis]